MQSEFEPYLKAIAHLYSQQNALYTPTDALLPLEARSVEQQDTQQPQERQVEPPFPVLTGLRKYALGERREHVLLTGRPGSGKSTALKQLAVALAEEGQVPVLVQLKGDRTVPELIQAEFRRAKQRVTLEQIEDWLLADRLILLLDGVNEIPNDDLRRGLAQFREDNSTVPMIFTTRELAVGGDLGIGKRLEMKPLSEPQMREFVQKYLPEYGEQLLGQLRDRLREIAETPLFLKMLCDVFKQTREIPQSKGELFRQFDRNYERLKKDYATVSKNFWEFKSEVLQHLAFSMIQADVQKPTDLWLTISKYRAESLLEEWLNQRGVVDAPTKAKEWLKDLCNHHLLQDAAKPGEIEFHHQLFQEYYAAEYLLQKLPTLLEDENRFKRDYLNYLKWTEPLALMLALLENEAQALQIVELALDIDLMLGARLAGEVKASFQSKTIECLLRLFMPSALKIDSLARTKSSKAIPALLQALNEQDLEVRYRAVCGLGEIGGKDSLPALLKVLEDDSLDIRDFAIDALVGMKSEIAISSLVALLEHQDPSLRETAAHVLGEIVSKAAAPGLFKALDDQDLDVRLSAAIALGELGEQAAIPYLLQALDSENSYTCCRAAKILGELGSEAAIPGLLKTLEDEDPYIRRNSIGVLGKHNNEVAILGLFKALDDQDIHVQISASDTLKKLNKEVAIPIIYKFLENEDLEIRRGAVKSLGELGSEADITRLLKALEDENSEVRSSAARAIGKLSYETAVPGLFHALKHHNPLVRRSVVDALGNLGSAVAVPELLQILEDEDWLVQLSVVEALGEIGDTSAVPKLLQVLRNQNLFIFFRLVSTLGKDKNFLSELLQVLKKDNNLESTLDEDTILEVLQILIKRETFLFTYFAITLGKLGSRIILPFLLQCLNLSDWRLRYKVVNALGELGDEAAIPALLQALKDQEGYVRQESADALGKLGNVSAIPGLLQALEDENRVVHYSAEKALEKLSNEAAIPELLQVLSSQNWRVRSIAANILGNLGNNSAVPELLKALRDSVWEVQHSAARAIEKLDSPEVLADLWCIYRQQPEFDLSDTIAAIQNRCQYYNHEIAHGLIPQGQAIALFFSYASKDEALQNELAKHLNLLERQGVITSWDSRQILPGDEREQVINQQLNTADIILLLISSDSIADNTCYDLEIRRAMERHQAGEAHVIPILLRPVDWAGSSFSQLPVLPKNKQPVTSWDNRDEAFREIAEGIRAVAFELRRVMG